ncbi:MAG TPA: efflux RND transporter periplasmic adaptor subunit [Pseudomonadales bacterium]|nr:efflux RND transporter periplasmic adaptor subunit [Pseudomonadales bacterium]
MTRSRRLAVFGGILAVVLVIAAIAITSRMGGTRTKQAKNTGPAAALTVQVIHPTPMNWPRLVTSSGNIAAWQEAIVSAQIGGAPIAEVLVDVGDQVKQGQLLARFDDANIQANLAQARAQVSEARANLEQANSKAKRAEQLKKTNNLSEQDLIAATTAKKAAEAQLKSAEARLESSRLDLTYTKVVAPDDGVISSRSATLGKVGGVGAELFRLVRKDRLEWRAQLTADQIVNVKPGMHANIQLPDGREVEGTVRQLAPTLDDNTRMGIAYVELASSTEARAGMYASGTIVLGNETGMSLPSTALVNRDGRDYVFLVTKDNRVTLETVSTGRRRGADVEIVAGVDAKSPVVEKGGAFLNDGDRVKVTDQGASS